MGAAGSSGRKPVGHYLQNVSCYVLVVGPESTTHMVAQRLPASNVVNENHLGTHLANEISKVAIYIPKMKISMRLCGRSMAWVSQNLLFFSSSWWETLT